MKKITLNNGATIDIVGCGTNTFGKENNEYRAPITMDTHEVVMAIENGYRHFDTAISYRNEEVLGKGIRESGISRDKFFITSKIPGRSPHIDSENNVVESIELSLKQLGVETIDLYLIHHPWDNAPQIFKVWQELENAVDEGLIRSIGVSNFDEKELKTLYDQARIKPSVNQIESHPGKWNHDLIQFTQSLGVAVAAWSPLSVEDQEAQAVLTQIGEKYQKSWAQVILRYQIERDVIVIPKSHNDERQQENLDIFDFELTDKEKEIIAKL